MVSLIELNRPKLQSLFSSQARELKLSFPSFEKICKTLKIIPDLVGQASFRSMLTKLSKNHLTYKQFESLLKQIASTNIQGKSTSEKLQKFFKSIAAPAKKHYSVSFVLKSTRRRTTDSRQSPSPSLGESLEIDLNIQEALDALKHRKTLSRSSSLRNSLSESNRALGRSSSKHDKTPVNPRSVTEHQELQEFIEVEKQVQKEAVKVTVNLRHKRQTRAPPKLAHIDLVSENVTKFKPSSSVDVDANKKRNGMLVDKHREFIAKTRFSTFSCQFVLRLILHAWRGLAHKNHS